MKCKKIRRSLLAIFILFFTSIAIGQTETKLSELIIDMPDKESMFPGGTKEMMKFISENTEYPEAALEAGDQGRVYIEFVVDKKGSIRNVTVLRGVSKELDEEAIRVVSSMPRWIPAEYEDEKVSSKARIPISFMLRKGK